MTPAIPSQRAYTLTHNNGSQTQIMHQRVSSTLALLITSPNSCKFLHSPHLGKSSISRQMLKTVMTKTTKRPIPTRCCISLYDHHITPQLSYSVAHHRFPSIQNIRLSFDPLAPFHLATFSTDTPSPACQGHFSLISDLILSPTLLSSKKLSCVTQCCSCLTLLIY